MFGKKDSSQSPRYTNGPVVKTGPTSGQNRSKNKDGRWRAKRSDTGSSKKSWCFITTAVCSYKGLTDNCYELKTLRWYRDNQLLNTAEGRAMVDHYYSIAPAIAERIVGAVEFEQIWDVVSKCVRCIELNQYDEATAMYVAMVQSLQEKLLAE